MKITMVGHSSVLIEAGGQRILTDPFFGVRGNPAYERHLPPAFSREALNNIDLVLLSHNHWDHVDTPFFRSLSPEVPVLAPRQAVWLTRMQGAKKVVGVYPWEAPLQYGSVAITAVPACHSAITIGFVIESEGRQIYFAGDTYYRPFMSEIGQRFRLDLAFIPVTTYRVPMTMGEAEAVRAVRDLSPEVVIPIHLSIRPRSPLLRTKDTPEGFEKKAREAGLKVSVVHLRGGETWELPTLS